MKKILIVFAAVGAVFLLIAGAIGGFAYWGWGLFSDQVRVALDDNAVIQQQIGPIEKMKFDFMATGLAPESDVFVFRLKGAKGEGVVRAAIVTVDAETEEIRSGTLKVPSGEVFELVPEDGSSGGEDPSTEARYLEDPAVEAPLFEEASAAGSAAVTAEPDTGTPDESSLEEPVERRRKRGIRRRKSSGDSSPR